jgi:hypothetical protein
MKWMLYKMVIPYSAIFEMVGDDVRRKAITRTVQISVKLLN